MVFFLVDSSRYASAPVPVKLQVNAEKLLPPAPVKETLSSGILGFLVCVILLDKVEDSKIQKDTSRVFSFPLGIHRIQIIHFPQDKVQKSSLHLFCQKKA